MPEADEVLLIKIMMQAEQALADEKTLQETTQTLKQQLKELAATMNGDVNKAAQTMEQAFKQSSDALNPTKVQQFSEGLSQAIKEVKAESTQLPGIFSRIGTALQVAFGFTAYQMVGNFVRAIREASQAGEEYLKTIFRLAASVQSLQGKGMNITFADSIKLASNLREQFGTFSKRESIDAVASVQLLTRNFKFNQEQIAKTAEVASALAIIQGKDVDESARQLALFYSSGYAEALQRAGFAVNRLTVAEEAGRLGYGKSYLALTEVQRAQAAYSLVTRQASDIVQAATEYQKTFVGELQASRKELETFTDTMGAKTVPALARITTIGAKLATVFLSIGESLQRIGIEFWSDFTAGIVTATAALVMFWKTLSGQGRFGIGDIIKTFGDARQAMMEELSRIAYPERYNPLGGTVDTQRGITADTEEELQNMQDAYDAAKSKIEDIENDKRTKLISINQDLQDDLAKIERDGARKREELARNYSDKIAQVNIDAARSRAAASRDLARDLAQIDIDIARRKSELEQKRRDDELTAERRFQNRLKRLQEEFLFDLEDAVRARDAKQIRRLQRRYALDKTQLMREGKTDKEERDRRFQEEMADLAVQREQRRQDRMVDFQQQLADIEIQRQQRLEEAAIEYKQQLDDLKRNMEEQRRERLIQFQNQLRDLSRSINDRLRLVAQGWAEEYKLTVRAAQEIYNALRQYFGPDGAIDQLFRYYYAYLAQVEARRGTSGVTTAPATPGGFAEGGSFVATRPTTKQFGEKGAELVTAIPLGRVGRNVNKLFGASAGGTGGRSGRLAIALMLSPDLEARIVEKSLGEFSDVMVSVERMR